MMSEWDQLPKMSKNAMEKKVCLQTAFRMVDSLGPDKGKEGGGWALERMRIFESIEKTIVNTPFRLVVNTMSHCSHLSRASG